MQVFLEHLLESKLSLPSDDYVPGGKYSGSGTDRLETLSKILLLSRFLSPALLITRTLPPTPHDAYSPSPSQPHSTLTLTLSLTLTLTLTFCSLSPVTHTLSLALILL